MRDTGCGIQDILHLTSCIGTKCLILHLPENAYI